MISSYSNVQDYIASIQVNGNILAILDCLLCFANNAIHFNYKKPELHEGLHFDVKECRHPVIERYLPPESNIFPTISYSILQSSK
jgi:DNA mismatch repair protein MutS